MEFNCDFNAPMFVDFENMDQEANPDAFFDMNHEDGGGQPLDLGENFGGDLDKALEKEINAPAHKTQPRLTRSVGQPLKTLTRQQTVASDPLRAKSSAATASLKTITHSATKPQYISKERAARVVERLCPATSTLKKPKFVSLAEESRKFFGTPERYHTRSTIKPRSSSAHTLFKRKRSPSPAARAVFATNPQSPKLLTRGRSRSRIPEVEPQITTTSKPIATSKIAAFRKRVGSLNINPLRPSTVSKPKPTSSLSLKKPLKTVAHHGIPIILHKKTTHKVETVNQKSSTTAVVNAGTSNFKNPRKPQTTTRNALYPLKPSVHHKLFQQGEEQRAKLERERRNEIDREKQLAIFKATEAKVLEKRPFLPKPSDKSPVKALDTELHTEQRAEERKNFDQFMRQKEAELQARHFQQLEKMERQQRIDSLRQRNATIQKANPIRHYNAIEIHPSDKPVTQPKTPMFRASKRNRHRSQ
jgi:hypothetical protein